jgi:hypothetical protein
MSLISLSPRLGRPAASHSFFDVRYASLVRGSLLVLGSFFASFPLSGFPGTRATLLLAIPALLAILGTVDTARCMHGRWTLYQGGIYFLLLMDMMAICMILFFLITPYLF